MITVRFFGTLLLELELASVQIPAQSIDELLIKINKQYPVVKLKDLKNSLIFVNGIPIANLNRFRTVLKAGDEVAILSPIGGG